METSKAISIIIDNIIRAGQTQVMILLKLHEINTLNLRCLIGFWIHL